ncbi:hypothetical protein MSG28_014333 [Choristoneura fumiferana]|uniref:Uncharacterized protein n=1 Tax=Choristoneura fumiferana TaxID=7141 RepID=A0ACC0JGV1_CHOFU|nr:hypothetical protein MSG28_014333 [Choristoneura fumiferana]
MYYDKKTQALPPLIENQSVFVKLQPEMDKKWYPGKIVGRATDRSYIVQVDGRLYRRNRVFIKPHKDHVDPFLEPDRATSVSGTAIMIRARAESPTPPTGSLETVEKPANALSVGAPAGNSTQSAEQAPINPPEQRPRRHVQPPKWQEDYITYLVMVLVLEMGTSHIPLNCFAASGDVLGEMRTVVRTGVSLASVLFMSMGVVLLIANLTDSNDLAMMFVWGIMAIVIIGVGTIACVTIECMVKDTNCLLSGMDWFSAAFFLVATAIYLFGLRLLKQGLCWQSTGRRRPGRPRTTWRRSVEKEAGSIGLGWEELKGNRARSSQMGNSSTSPMSLVIIAFSVHSESVKIGDDNNESPRSAVPSEFQVLARSSSDITLCCNRKKYSVSHTAIAPRVKSTGTRQEYAKHTLLMRVSWWSKVAGNILLERTRLVRAAKEKNREQSRRMCICFVDLEKTFDSVPREALWVVHSKIGCTENFVRLLRLLHDDMQCCVALDSEQSNFLPVTCGVKQGCVLARVCVTLTPRLTAESELQLQHSLVTSMEVFEVSIMQQLVRRGITMYKDVLKRTMKSCTIVPSQWENEAANRQEWRAKVKAKPPRL